MNRKVDKSEYVALSRVQRIIMSLVSVAILIASLYLHFFTHALFGFSSITVLVIIGFACVAIAGAGNFHKFSRVYIATIVVLVLLLLSVCGILFSGDVMQQSNAVCYTIDEIGSCTVSAEISALALCSYFIPPISILCIIALPYQATAILSARKR